MGFLETIANAKDFLREHGRVSLRALQLEFGLADDQAEALVEELVDVQQVAALEGKVLSWIGSATALPAAEAEAAPTTPGANAARSPAEAERRQLTVMFCDLVGSTDLSQRLDPEDLREVVRAYQESASSVIERYEGHIAQYLGDGLLVYFGYPRAHEDDAERAVRAGREILTALGTLNDRLEPEHGIRLAARVGIHTGPVVVGEMGGEHKSETLALGDTPNIAARLESVAEPDSVVISGATLRLVPGLFVTKDLGTPSLKGIAEPIRAYAVLQATGVRSRLDVDPSKLTPLVGREQEVGLLLERWERAQKGEGHTVLISGEAGLGKSRLLRTFRERLAEMPHGWLECRCSPYTQGSAFHPLVELVEQGLGFTEGDDADTKLTRIEGGIAAAGLSAPGVVPLLAPLLSLPLRDRYPPLQFSPELQRKKTIEALVAWILRLSEQQPLVMLVEDLHWCDPSTVELLGGLLEESRTAEVLTLLSFRPDFEPPWSARSQLTALAVDRLSRRQAGNLIGGMTRDVPLPSAVVERVVERADGVPLFVEELTKMVLESGLLEERDGRYELTHPLTDLAIPTTLQDSLMARLDRLDEAKEVAQLGSVLGREFSFELVDAVSYTDASAVEASLARLVDAQLLFQRGTPPAASYTFKHALVQDAAYESLLKRTRRQFHLRVAQALSERLPGRAETAPERIAQHYEGAGRTNDAIAHYRRAGQQAAQRSANAEAIAHLTHSTELLAELPESPERSRQELELLIALGPPVAAAKGFGSEDAEHTYRRARELCREVGAARELIRALQGLISFYTARGELETAHELADQSLHLATSDEDSLPLLIAHLALGNVAYLQGKPARALEHLDRAIALHDPSEHQTLAYTMGADRGLTSRIWAAWALWQLGYADRARERSREAVELARQGGHPLSLAYTLCSASIVHVLRREPDQAREQADEAVAISEEQGLPLFLGLGLLVRGWARIDPRGTVEETREAIDEATRGTGLLGSTGTQAVAPHVLGELAGVYHRIGADEDALGAVEAGLAISARTQQPFWDAELFRLKGEILLAKDGDERREVERLFRKALDIAHSQEAKSLELRAAMSLARLWQRQGKTDEARALLQPVYAWFTEGFDTQDLKDAKALLEELE